MSSHKHHSKYNDLIRDYKESLVKSRINHRIGGSSSVSPDRELSDEEQAVLNSATDSIKRNISRVENGLSETLRSVEREIMLQYGQLAEIKSIVELERNQLEKAYGIRIPGDNLPAIVKLKKEKEKELETSLIDQQKQFEEEARNKIVELELKGRELAEKERSLDSILEEKKKALEFELQEKDSIFNTELEKKKAYWATQEEKFATIQDEFDHALEEKRLAFDDEIKLKTSEWEAAFDKKKDALQSEIGTLENKRLTLEKEIQEKQTSLDLSFYKKEKAFEENIRLKERTLKQKHEAQELKFLMKERDQKEQLAALEKNHQQRKWELEKEHRVKETELKNQLNVMQDALTKKYGELEQEIESKKQQWLVDSARHDHERQVRMQRESELADQLESLHHHELDKLRSAAVACRDELLDKKATNERHLDHERQRLEGEFRDEISIREKELKSLIVYLQERAKKIEIRLTQDRQELENEKEYFRLQKLQYQYKFKKKVQEKAHVLQVHYSQKVKELELEKALLDSHRKRDGLLLTKRLSVIRDKMKNEISKRYRALQDEASKLKKEKQRAQIALNQSRRENKQKHDHEISQIHESYQESEKTASKAAQKFGSITAASLPKPSLTAAVEMGEDNQVFQLMKTKQNADEALSSMKKSISNSVGDAPHVDVYPPSHHSKGEGLPLRFGPDLEKAMEDAAHSMTQSSSRYQTMIDELAKHKNRSDTAILSDASDHAYSSSSEPDLSPVTHDRNDRGAVASPKVIRSRRRFTATL